MYSYCNALLSAHESFFPYNSGKNITNLKNTSPFPVFLKTMIGSMILIKQYLSEAPIPKLVVRELWFWPFSTFLQIS